MIWIFLLGWLLCCHIIRLSIMLILPFYVNTYITYLSTDNIKISLASCMLAFNALYGWIGDRVNDGKVIINEIWDQCCINAGTTDNRENKMLPLKNEFFNCKKCTMQLRDVLEGWQNATCLQRELATQRSFDFLLPIRHNLLMLNAKGMTVVEPYACLFGNICSFHYVIKF